MQRQSSSTTGTPPDSLDHDAHNRLAARVAKNVFVGEDFLMTNKLVPSTSTSSPSASSSSSSASSSSSHFQNPLSPSLMSSPTATSTSQGIWTRILSLFLCFCLSCYLSSSSPFLRLPFFPLFPPSSLPYFIFSFFPPIICPFPPFPSFPPFHGIPYSIDFVFFLFLWVFSFLDQSSHLCKRVCPSVCPSALWKTNRKRRFQLAGCIVFSLSLNLHFP